MLTWNRFVPSKARALIALGTLTALVAVAALQPFPSVWGQDKEKTPARKVEKKGEEKKGEEKTEEAPVKEEEAQEKGRAAKKKDPMKEPMKEEGKTPRKTEGKDPMKEPMKEPKKEPMKEVGKGPPVRGRPMPEKEMKEPVEGKRPVIGKEGPKVTPKVVEKVVVEGLPKDFEEQQRKAYDRLEHKDLSFEEYLEQGKHVFQRMRDLEKNPALRYQPGKRGRAPHHPVCENGDFENESAGTDVNPGEWAGANGMRNDNTGNDKPTSFVAGLVSGPIVHTGGNIDAGHQTIVSAGTDPNVPIQMTGPNTGTNNAPSAHAVRIGNAVNANDAQSVGVDILSKTFVVTPSDALIKFWYAVVMENPTDNHPEPVQPNFEVRVFDTNDLSNPLTGLVNLGGNSSILIADVVNPFFHSVPGSHPSRPIVYTDWKCAQIDLSRQVGKTVTVEFITRDCALGGHWGYAYLDNFCGDCEGSPGGDIAFDPDSSDLCGKGKVCYTYTLPTSPDKEGNVITGTAVLSLAIYQHGNLLQTLTSPTLSDGQSYCFPIDRTTIPGIAAGGFDFVGSGAFTLGSYNATLSEGSAPHGQVEGPNNDYDNPEICNGTPGTIVYDEKASTHCDKGQICFNVTLPTRTDPKGNIITATGQIHLTLYKGGVAVVSLPASPVLSAQTGTSYCFPIDPASISGLNPGGFDFVATAVFSFGTSATVGTVPNGVIPGPNNDYNDPRICPDEPPVEPKECGCCPGKELVKNGGFDQGGGEFDTEYKWSEECSTFIPGTYSVYHVEKIRQCCSNWVLPRECRETKDFSENVLIVNGQTNQPAGSTAVIWSQQISLPSGEKEADYHLCFRYLPLPQCCFDIQAKPYVLVNGGKIPLTDHCDEDNGCGRIYAATFHGAGTVNVQIVLPGDGKGDGNDLLIGNISMVKIEPVPANQLTFSPDAGDVANDMFDVKSDAPTALVSSSCTWDWELYRGHASNVMDPALFTLVQGSTQANQPTSTFTGLPISDGNGTIMYWVKLTVDCGCSKGAVYRPAAQIKTLRSLKLEGKSIEDPNPQRVKRVKAAPAPAPVKRSE